MPFIEQYISDGREIEDELRDIQEALFQLGFDRQEEKAQVFAYYQITEGYDIYEQALLHLQVQTSIIDQPAIVDFGIRALRDSHAVDFLLNDVTAKLCFKNGDGKDEVLSKSYGRPGGFPTRDEMLQDLSEKVIQLTKLNQIKNLFGIGAGPPVVIPAHTRNRHV